MGKPILSTGLLLTWFAFSLTACSDQAGEGAGFGAGGENINISGVISSSAKLPEQKNQVEGISEILDCDFICTITIAGSSGELVLSEQVVVGVECLGDVPVNGQSFPLLNTSLDPSDERIRQGLSLACSCEPGGANLLEQITLNFDDELLVALGPDGALNATCSLSNFIDFLSGAEAQAFFSNLGCFTLIGLKAILDPLCEEEVPAPPGKAAAPAPEEPPEEPGFICGFVRDMVEKAGVGLGCFEGEGGGEACGDGVVTPPEQCDPNGGNPLCREPFRCKSDCSGCEPGDSEACGDEICDGNTEDPRNCPLDCGCDDCQEAIDTAGSCEAAGFGPCDQTFGCCRANEGTVGLNECSNGIDDDADGAVDCADATGCAFEDICSGVTVESEPNGELLSSDIVGRSCDGLVVHANIDSADVGSGDWFALTVPVTVDLRLETTGSEGPGTCLGDTDLSLLDPTGNIALASDGDSGTGPCSLIDPQTNSGARRLSPGIYFATVGSKGPIEGYQLRISCVALCGDGNVEGSEECDDGDVRSGDGCNRFCRTETAPEEDLRRIAFGSNRSLRGTNGRTDGPSVFNLWIVYEDGVGAVPLTHYNFSVDNRFLVADWSPNGKQITFHSVGALDGSDRGHPTDNVWVVNTDGSNLQPLTHLTATQAFNDLPKWSPDGSRILFESSRDLSGGDFPNSNITRNIWVMNADGGNPTPLTFETTLGPGLSLPRWSPNGSQIVFQSGRSPLSDGTPNANQIHNIWVMGSDGADPLSLTNFSSGGEGDGGFEPLWSPDGARITFHNLQTFRQNVWVMQADGSEPLPLTETNAANNFASDWSPDGTQVLFQSNRNLDGTDSVSPNNVTNIWTIPASGVGLPDPLTEMTGPGDGSTAIGNFAGRWSPNGDRVVFQSNRALDGSDALSLGPAINIWIMNSDGSNPQPLTRLDATNDSDLESTNPRWEK